MNPKVTVIIPCYNHSKYVGRAIESVQQQDYDDVALSIVDDASIDDSFNVIKNLFSSVEVDCANENKEKIVKGKIDKFPASLIGFTQNQKQAAARNRAIQEYWDSDFFLTLDADDILFPNKISKSVEVALEHPDRIGLVYSDAIIHNEDNDTYIHEFRRPYDRKILEQENIISNVSLISKKALEKVGLYDIGIDGVEDFSLWIRITEHFTAVHIPEPLHTYTVTGQNHTFTMSEEEWNRKRKIVIEKMIERRK